jgi:hypothetical protein
VLPDEKAREKEAELKAERGTFVDESPPTTFLTIEC